MNRQFSQSDGFHLVLAQLDPVARTMLRGVCRDFRRGVDASGLKRAGGGLAPACGV